MFKWHKLVKILRTEGVKGKLTPESVFMIIDSGWLADCAFIDYVGGKDKAQEIVDAYLQKQGK